MKITAKVKPGSKKYSVEKTGDNEYILRVKEKAIEGEANKAAVKLLGEHFGIPRSRFSILKGHKSRNKIITIT